MRRPLCLLCLIFVLLVMVYMTAFADIYLDPDPDQKVLLSEGTYQAGEIVISEGEDQKQEISRSETDNQEREISRSETDNQEQEISLPENESNHKLYGYIYAMEEKNGRSIFAIKEKQKITKKFSFLSLMVHKAN